MQEKEKYKIDYSGENVMATILVDYENVYASNGLKGVDALSVDDVLIIFYSDSCRKSDMIICNLLMNQGASSVS